MEMKVDLNLNLTANFLSSLFALVSFHLYITLHHIILWTLDRC
jgi:hypothetical protein